MNRQATNRYLPDYAVAPGEVLDEYLESVGMKQAELADRLGYSKKTINEIITGKARITPECALKLERVFGRPASFWNNLESQFQDDRVRLREAEQFAEDAAWLKRVPYREMVKLGFVEPAEDVRGRLDVVLRFFGVASPAQWRTIWERHQVAYRQSQRFEANAEAVSAWLRQGELQAQQVPCGEFDKQRFRAVLEELRALTLAEPQDFVPEIVRKCGEVGVAVVFVPELPRTRVSRATRWVGGRPIIQLSLRYKTNDHLWFTFFHEAGHILKHGRKLVFLEGKGMDGEQEDEANAFARDLLIPQRDWRGFLAAEDFSLASIRDFAARVGIAAGIVVGRLQHEQLISHAIGNGLKVRYEWTITAAK